MNTADNLIAITKELALCMPVDRLADLYATMLMALATFALTPDENAGYQQALQEVCGL